MMAPPPHDTASLAHFILSPECRKIGALTGAGISQACGIPDFRSPGGLYDQLRPEFLTVTPSQRTLLENDPAHVVSWDMFSQNSFPYMEVRRPFILGTQERQWKPSIAHRVLELIHVKTGKLQRIYTQNIDGLHSLCDRIPKSKIIPVHGSIDQVECEGCGAPMEFDPFCDLLRTHIKDIYSDDDDDTSPTESTPIPCPSCQKPLVKPSTVMFGRPLPELFFSSLPRDAPTWDVLLIMGTSLMVSPANSVATTPGPRTIRVLINRELVGTELGLLDDNSRRRDVFLEGDCDDVALQLAAELGWLDDLAKLDLPEGAMEKVKRAQQENAYKGWF